MEEYTNSIIGAMEDSVNSIFPDSAGSIDFLNEMQKKKAADFLRPSEL